MDDYSLAATKHHRQPAYHDVRLRKSGKWVTEIRAPGTKSRFWLGTYHTAEMAARAHDMATLAIKGITGRLNFPDQAHLLPRPATFTPEAFLAAAKLAASADFLPHSGASASDLLSYPNGDQFDLTDMLMDMTYESWSGLASAASAHIPHGGASASSTSSSVPDGDQFDLTDMLMDMTYESWSVLASAASAHIPHGHGDANASDTSSVLVLELPDLNLDVTYDESWSGLAGVPPEDVQPATIFATSADFSHGGANASTVPDGDLLELPDLNLDITYESWSALAWAAPDDVQAAADLPHGGANANSPDAGTDAISPDAGAALPNSLVHTEPEPDDDALFDLPDLLLDMRYDEYWSTASSWFDVEDPLLRD